ncbi:CAP domain-containing protein [Devosia sp. PTR5]|uniref:CAP domain-containing protein n=1 Tax=Devosia oryzisoli TaxID=2774138 RepID=A0A927ITA7_9HYPH|nr:CAP domain-containing protein [Devosia oryzisoli]MBD8065613.1 CAP domain-containing protein [Devosia oryzisoli]
MTLPDLPAGDAVPVFTRRALLVLGTSAILAACSSTIPPLPAATDNRPESLSRDQILAAINKVRAANGAPPWSYNPRLEAAARSQARLMASKDTLSHDLGVTLRQRVTEVGYLGAVGENVAKGYKTLPEVIQGWLGSAGHRNTLLSPKFVEFGLATARTSSGKLYWGLIAGGSFDAWRA